jgi:hypothetical protein
MRTALDRLLSIQQTSLSDLNDELGKESTVFFLLASRPEVIYDAALRDCFQLYRNRQEVLLEIRYLDEDGWTTAGPDTSNGVIILSTPPVWHMAGWEDRD